MLDTETVSSFTNGVYLNWAVQGDVVITFTHEAGVNAVLSGIFIDPAVSSDSETSIASNHVLVTMPVGSQATTSSPVTSGNTESTRLETTGTPNSSGTETPGTALGSGLATNIPGNTFSPQFPSKHHLKAGDKGHGPPHLTKLKGHTTQARNHEAEAADQATRSPS